MSLPQQFSSALTPFSEATAFPGYGPELAEIGGELERRSQLDLGITVLPKISNVTVEHIRERFPTGPVVVCDFYIVGIEKGLEHPWGYRLNGIDNIDHHAPRPIMTQAISSGNQSCMYVETEGLPSASTPVVINHTDCDSTVSSLTARGHIPPHPVFQRAVLCADHTLEREPIADLLQALEPAQDLVLCARSLAALLQGKELPSEALPYIERSDAERRLAAACFERGSYEERAGAVLLLSDSPIESSFVVPLFPEAAVVINAFPSRLQVEGAPRWDVKIRLGQHVPAGVTLDTLGVKQFDSNFGGRWNAGSTSRAGGTTRAPQEFLNFIAEKLASR